MFNYKVFSTKLHTNEMFALREFKLYSVLNLYLCMLVN